MEKQAAKKITEAIETNKDLSIDFSKWKANITKIRYKYFDFDKEKIEAIAKKNSEDDITDDNFRTIIQALFPQYLLCSGFIDSVIIFIVNNGVREDPPKYYYSDLRAYLNNDNEAKVNRLSDEIKDLFEKNEIEYSDLWKDFFSEEKNET